uniref:SXP/RAL-2 family protein Ani s 5-like cation-binding domain-containing protein n=1 Tax=Panagrolaimus davidi TaxID=227884 RepID=A0A914PF03_9BILA
MSDNGQQIIRKLFLDAFSKSMNAEQKQELEKIVDNKNLTKQQIHDQIKALCEKSGSESVKKFDEIEKFIEGIKEHVSKKVEKVEGKLSSDALTFVKHVQQIYEDKTITPIQEEQKLKELANNASPLLKKELKFHDICSHLF